jgi:hypothetical protein
LNENRPLVTVVMLLLVIASVVFAIWYSLKPQQRSFGTREFFTDDDGTTWFVDDGTKIAPFDHNGKPAVMARVFKCKSTGEPFVGYLEKFDDDARKRIQTARETGQLRVGLHQDTAGSTSSGIMLKKPRTGEWVHDNDPAAREIRNVTCPGGGKDFEPIPP